VAARRASVVRDLGHSRRSFCSKTKHTLMVHSAYGEIDGVVPFGKMEAAAEMIDDLTIIFFEK
jgi:hypothetical protein